MRTPDDIAIEQRDYWLEVERETKNYERKQGKPGEPSLFEVIETATPSDWAEAWNLQLPGDKRR